MNLDTTREVVALVGGVLVILGAVAGWARWLRPKARQASAVAEAILGRPKLEDRSGALIQPAQPGLVAQVSAINETLSALADTHRRVNRLEERVDSHDLLLTELNSSHRERIANKAEQIAAWSAIEAVSRTTPPTED